MWGACGNMVCEDFTDAPNSRYKQIQDIVVNDAIGTIRQLPDANVDQCMMSCTRTSMCKGFMVRDRGGGCVLKNKLEYAGQRKGTSTYVKKGPYVTSQNNWILGSEPLPRRTYFNRTPANCKEMCDANPYCIGYQTRDDDGSKCSLISAKALAAPQNYSMRPSFNFTTHTAIALPLVKR